VRLVLLLLLANGTCSMGRALACSCGQSPPPKGALASSSSVFVGKTIAIRDSVEKSLFGQGYGYRLLATVRVGRTWKGVSADTVLLVLTGHGGGDCGYPFERGQEYLIYADGPRAGFFRTNICTRTTMLQNASTDLKELGPPLRNRVRRSHR
jgi:hypothetical protein